MIDMKRLEKLERLAHEAETATNAMWREMYTLYKEARNKASTPGERVLHDLNAVVLHVPIKTLVSGRDCISRMMDASRLGPTLDDYEAAKTVMQLLARLIAIRTDEEKQ